MSILIRNGVVGINSVLTSNDVSDGSKVLYSYLAGLETGIIIDKDKLADVLNLSKPALARRVNELLNLHVLTIGSVGNINIWYIGSLVMDSMTVVTTWESII